MGSLTSSCMLGAGGGGRKKAPQLQRIPKQHNHGPIWTVWYVDEEVRLGTVRQSRQITKQTYRNKTNIEESIFQSNRRRTKTPSVSVLRSIVKGEASSAFCPFPPPPICSVYTICLSSIYSLEPDLMEPS